MTLRVAAYCRVSTDKTDQLGSFESQKTFFREYISRRSDWVLAGIYADEGITGTSAADRTAFLKMICDATTGLVDLIVTKEVSRFSRNILDAVAYTRKLKNAGVGVIFLNDGISTLDPDSELRLGIMASVAQEESRKTSQRVKWGQCRSMERGVVFGPGLLGYDVKNGRIAVEPAGAEIVRSIFALYVYENKGVRAIADTLTERGIPTKTNQNVWLPATVLKILKNEKYCGDLTQRKTVISDYLTHKKTVNRDETALICLTDHHEPIIEKALWEAAQAERKRRSSFAPPSSGHGSRYPLSGKISCSKCGGVFTCRTRKRSTGSTYRTWCGGSCVCFGGHAHFREELLTACIRQIFASLAEKNALDRFMDILARLAPDHKARQASLLHEITGRERKKLKLIDAFISGDISREEYLPLKKRVDDTLRRLREELLATDDGPQDEPSAIAEYTDALSSGRGGEPDFFLNLVERIAVIRPDKIAVFLKNGSGSWTVSFTA